MGSKRLGLARTQALLESLNREIEGGSLTFKNLKIQEATSGSAGSADSRGAPQQMTISFLFDSGSYENAGYGQEIQLSGADGKSHTGLPIGFCATSGWIEVVTALTSTGSATITIGTAGTSNDPDGFLSSSAYNDAALAVNKVRGFNGALVSNSSINVGLDSAGYRVVTTADPVTMTISTSKLDTGKFYVHVNGYMHKYNG
jgi:hypothetical protein